MPIIDLKRKLHDAIDTIQDEQVLEALLIIISVKEKQAIETALYDTQLKELEHRAARFNNGESKAMPVASFKSHMRKKYGI